MNSVLNQHLGCTNCRGESRVSDAFDAAFQSWPRQGWIAYRCPTCGTTNHLALSMDTVTEGYLIGTTDVCHVTTRVVSIPALSVKSQSNGIVIRTLNLSWNIPA